MQYLQNLRGLTGVFFAATPLKVWGLWAGMRGSKWHRSFLLLMRSLVVVGARHCFSGQPGHRAWSGQQIGDVCGSSRHRKIL